MIRKVLVPIAVVIAMIGLPSHLSASSPHLTRVAAQLPVVRVAQTPFYDHQFLSVAKKLGWDKQLGVNLQLIWFTQSSPSIEALVHGSVDIVTTCVVCNFPFYQSVPQLTDFLTENQFKGFVLVGRRGQAKPYSQFLKQLKSPQKAKLATIRQVRGKAFPEYRVNYDPLLRAMLEQAGLQPSDINEINFPDDEKAALAMIGGTGDFYIGGLPSEINLLLNHPSKFVLVGGREILGPAGLWYSNLASNHAWLHAHPDLALKIIAMSYRYNRYINSDPEKVLPIVRDAMNSHSGANLSLKQLRFVYKTFLGFRTYQQEAKQTYNPKSPYYWGLSAKYYVKQSTTLPSGANWHRNNPLQFWFKAFQKNPSLVQWVDRPLT